MITTQNVYYRYPATESFALDNISMRVPRHCAFGLIGPNGAGKTTLISLLTGVLPSQRGTMTIGDFRSPGNQREIRAITGLVPQDYAFYLTLSASENLQFFAKIHGLTRNQRQRRIEQCVEICGLQEVLHRRADTYSGGVKRRLNLALGLLHKPSILYLDEPTVGIDTQSRRFILDAIAALKTQGLTVIYTSHYMEEVQSICDQIAIIDQGKLLLQGSIEELLEWRAEKWLLIELNDPAPLQSLMSLQHIVPIHIEGQQLRIPVDSEGRQLFTILLMLRDSGLSISRLQYGTRSLEDMYLDLTRRRLRD
jgi:ABC-type multidrug transport system ATPase subunit